MDWEIPFWSKAYAGMQKKHQTIAWQYEYDGYCSKNTGGSSSRSCFLIWMLLKLFCRPVECVSDANSHIKSRYWQCCFGFPQEYFCVKIAVTFPYYIGTYEFVWIVMNRYESLWIDMNRCYESIWIVVMNRCYESLLWIVVTNRCYESWLGIVVRNRYESLLWIDMNLYYESIWILWGLPYCCWYLLIARFGIYYLIWFCYLRYLLSAWNWKSEMD